MLRLEKQIEFSDFEGLYARLIPGDHLLRQINGMTDFGFVVDELREKYCPDNGRDAESPIRMFKYLLLKAIYEMSDGDLVERSRYDMSFKYFLDYRPEDDVIDSSSLSKFRKLRLTDDQLLDLLIGKSVEIAIEQGVLKSKRLIVDSTHTRSRFRHLSPIEALREQSKRLRKSVYHVDETMREIMPAKPTGNDLNEEIEYCKKLLELVGNDEVLMFYASVKEKFNYLQEIVEDDLEHLRESTDEDARVGHKSADTSFFGYKTHIAMTEDGIITAATVTSGEKADGAQLQELVEKSENSGVEVEAVVGDAAYSEKANLDYAQAKDIQLVSKLMPAVSSGLRKKEDEFTFNKDAGMFVCKAGHMATGKTMRHNKQEFRKENPRMVYYFDTEKCKRCPYREGCYKEGSRSKSYSVSITSKVQLNQKVFQESEEFRSLSKKRYMIEAKNSELKNRHGYDCAESKGIHAMKIQGATALFAVNLMKIVRLMGK